MAAPIEPGSEEWHRRLKSFLDDPAPPQWWWLSFADPSLPKGSHLLGLAIVPAPNAVAAAAVAHALGCNPGGEVAALPAVPEGWTPRPEYVCRLMPPEEARAFAERELAEWAYPS